MRVVLTIQVIGDVDDGRPLAAEAGMPVLLRCQEWSTEAQTAAAAVHELCGRVLAAYPLAADNEPWEAQAGTPEPLAAEEGLGQVEQEEA